MGGWGTGQRMATPVSLRWLTVLWYSCPINDVRWRGQRKGQGDDRLTGCVKQLDLAPFQILPLGEGVDPSGRSKGDTGGGIWWVEHV